MKTLHIMIPSLSVVAIFALITFGAVSCSEQDRALRADCISSGGSVISVPNNNFHCIKSGRSE